MTRRLNILTLSTLFPNAAAPNFGIFVERQTAELASRPEMDVTVINPVGVPPLPFRMLAPYRALTALPDHEQWRGLDVHRPRFTLIPKFGGSQNPRRIARAILPLAQRLHSQKPFDLIDAEFFYPDGPAAMRLSAALGIPFTIKARGADLHHWGSDPKCLPQILSAADKASALLAVSGALKDDMRELGMDAGKIMVHYTGLDQKKFKPVDRAALKRDMGIEGPLFICVGALIKRKNQESFNYGDYFAYSKICTHIGCPTSLYEAQTNRILCPCHQSQFDALQYGKPVFGPAARALPELPINVDEDGYFYADGNFIEPVGPAFWERQS